MTYIPVSLTVLGCGNATGVPTVGCTCAVCRSPSVRNQRLRCSALLRMGRQQWLIDSGPDLRRQALAAGIDQIDGVLYTHPHSDHINGIDDLRAYCERLKTPIPVYGNPATLAALHHSYSYAFLPPGAKWAARNAGSAPARFHWIRKAYEQVDGIAVPEAIFANENDIAPIPMPDTDGRWATTRSIKNWLS